MIFLSVCTSKTRAGHSYGCRILSDRLAASVFQVRADEQRYNGHAPPGMHARNGSKFGNDDRCADP